MGDGLCDLEIEGCNPYLSQCAQDEACLWQGLDAYYKHWFKCVPTPGLSEFGGPCGDPGVVECKQGLDCENQVQFNEGDCGSDFCCTPYCYGDDDCPPDYRCQPYLYEGDGYPCVTELGPALGHCWGPG